MLFKILKKQNKIILPILKAFNSKGYYAYNLAELAKICGISRGNLAYHYKVKEDILFDIAIIMQQDIDAFQLKRRSYPAFSNLSIDIETCAFLQKKYPFVFRDVSVLEHKQICKVMQQWSQKIINQNIKAFAFGIKIGNIKEEVIDGTYYQLANNAWLLSYFWLAQKSLRKVSAMEKAELMIWSTILPYFTKKGLKEFEGFYGEGYLKKIGQSITQFSKQKITYT